MIRRLTSRPTQKSGQDQAAPRRNDRLTGSIRRLGANDNSSTIGKELNETTPTAPAADGLAGDDPSAENEAGAPTHEVDRLGMAMDDYELVAPDVETASSSHATSEDDAFTVSDTDLQETAIVNVTAVDQTALGRIAAREVRQSVLIDGATFFGLRSEPRKYVLPPFLERGNVSMLIGAPGGGKSLYAAYLTTAIAGGVPFMGEAPPGPAPVLWINAEDPVGEALRRMNGAIDQLGADRSTVSANFHTVDRDRGVKLFERGEDGVQLTARGEQIIFEAEEAGVGMIVVDPLIETHSVDENSNADMFSVMRCLRGTARELDCAILLVHHIGKSEGKVSPQPRGATALLGAVRACRVVVELGKQEQADYGISEADAFDTFKVVSLKQSYSRRGPPSYLKRFSVNVGGESTPVLRPMIRPNRAR